MIPMRKLVNNLLIAVAMFPLLGCGDGTPKQATDPAALEQERIKGRELRNNLEGGPKTPPGK